MRVDGGVNMTWIVSARSYHIVEYAQDRTIDSHEAKRHEALIEGNQNVK